MESADGRAGFLLIVDAIDGAWGAPPNQYPRSSSCPLDRATDHAVLGHCHIDPCHNQIGKIGDEWTCVRLATRWPGERLGSARIAEQQRPLVGIAKN